MRMSDWSSEVCSSDLLGGVSELEQHPIDPVERFGNFLDHQHVIGEIGKPGRADHAGEDREVEGGGGAAAEAGLKPLSIVRGEPREAARHRHVAAGAVEIGRASRRASVGQYVWISVVAAHLKTQMKQHCIAARRNPT